MGELTFQDIIEATGGRLIFGKPNGIGGVSIDSRTIRKNELFVAIKGARFDGHKFLGEALQRGCGAIVSMPPTEPPRGKVIIYVPNTIRALQDIAHHRRVKCNLQVVGITGSNGKTTTKEMLAEILGAENKVLKNTGNLNNQIGLPLSLLKLTCKEDVAVLEMGASYPGDIRELCEIAAPDYAVLTNIGHAHIEQFKDIETVRKTKLEILSYVRAAIVNGDDRFMMQGMGGFKGRVVTYGMDPANDVFADKVELGRDHISFVVNFNGKHERIRIGITGAINISNALAAIAMAILFGMEIQEIKGALECFEGIPMRLEIKELGGATVINDVYNANPNSMEEALKELVRLRRRRAIAVLGDMLELGTFSETAHRRLGRWMAGIPVDLFIAVGPHMSLAAEEFKRLKGEVMVVSNSAEAHAILMKEYRGDDTILVKGSRSMRMEQVVDPNGSSINNNGKRARADAI